MLNKIKVLIIDDDEVDRMMIVRGLKLTGLNIDICNATDFETGTALVTKTEFDFIFLDYNLPGNSGFEFLESYKAKGGKARVIVVTSFGDEQLAAQALEKGANNYIPKNLISTESISQLLNYSEEIKINGNSIHKPDSNIIASENSVETIVEQLPIILFSLDQYGIFTLFTGKGIEALSDESYNIKGKSIFETGDFLPVQVEDYKKALTGKNVCTSRKFNNHDYQIHFLPLLDQNNNPMVMNGVVIDITASKSYEITSKKNKYMNGTFNHANDVNTNSSAAPLNSISCSPLTKESPLQIPDATKTKCTDLSFLKQLAENNDSFFKDFICLFLQNAPETVDELVTALAKEDWEGIRQAAHKIKPSVSYLGMKDIQQAAAKVEENAKNQTNLSDIPQLVEKIKAGCSQAYLELEKELQEN
jgi:CheY-like chemotaxis protein